MWFAGLDVHARSSTVCILDQQGRKVKSQTIRGSWWKAIDWLKDLGHPFAVCYEASCGYGALYDALCKIACRVVVAHPKHLRWIYRSKRKHDRIDAFKLATLLYAGLISPVWVPSVAVRSWRQMIECRRRLLDKRTRCKNGLRSLLRSHGIVAPRGLWTRRGRSWLASVALPTPMACCQRDLLSDELDHFDGQVRRITKQLDQMGQDSPSVTLLRTIPGIGPRTAEAVVAYIDNPQRFSRTSQVAAYFGLVPCQDASASTNRLGHITREGPPTVRKLLVEAAWQVIRRCPEVRARFERIAGGKKDHRKIALVATAHYLLRCMFAMLRTGEVWRQAD